jgi:hypothetical protein
MDGDSFLEDQMPRVLEGFPKYNNNNVMKSQTTI